MAKETKRPASKSRPRQNAAPKAALVATRTPVPVRTRAELQRFVVGFVERVNKAIDEVGPKHNALADLIFGELFGDDVEAALDHDKAPTPEYLAVRERAGRSLGIDRRELSEYLRIGALRRALDTDAWDLMRWSKKRELLPLVKADPSLKLLRRGVAYAMRPKVGTALVREWVQVNTPREEGSVGGPRGLTLGSGQKLVETGRRIGDAEARARFAERVRAAPPESRREFVEGLRELVENVSSLLEEIEGR